MPAACDGMGGNARTCGSQQSMRGWGSRRDSGRAGAAVQDPLGRGRLTQDPAAAAAAHQRQAVAAAAGQQAPRGVAFAPRAPVLGQQCAPAGERSTAASGRGWRCVGDGSPDELLELGR